MLPRYALQRNIAAGRCAGTDRGSGVMTPEQRAADWFTLPPAARTKAWLAREFRKAIEEATAEKESK
jgi:hypothetical protein